MFPSPWWKIRLQPITLSLFGIHIWKSIIYYSSCMFVWNFNPSPAPMLLLGPLKDIVPCISFHAPWALLRFVELQAGTEMDITEIRCHNNLLLYWFSPFQYYGLFCVASWHVTPVKFLVSGYNYKIWKKLKRGLNTYVSNCIGKAIWYCKPMAMLPEDKKTENMLWGLWSESTTGTPAKNSLLLWGCWLEYFLCWLKNELRSIPQQT